MAIIVKDYRDYPEALGEITNGKMLVLNNDTNALELLKLSDIGGGNESIPTWYSAETYVSGYIVEYSDKLWASDDNGNEGNPPSDGSSYWTEVSKATVSNFSRWKVGVYNNTATLVAKGDDLYLLKSDTTLPFNSSDFDAELAAGTWIAQGGNKFNSIVLNPQTALEQTYEEGKIYYNSDLKRLTLYNDRPNSSLQIGSEMWDRVINKTGVVIDELKAVYISGFDATTGLPTIALAGANIKMAATGILAMTTHPFGIDEAGECVPFGDINDTDTSLLTANQNYFLSETPGEITLTPPNTPSYRVEMGQVMKVGVTTGIFKVRIAKKGNKEDAFNFYTGTTQYSVALDVTSDGSIVTLGVDNSASGAIVCYFKNAVKEFSVPTSIILTAGTDTVPVKNVIWIDENLVIQKATGVTADFPSLTQYIPLFSATVPSALRVQNYGLYRGHAWSDHIEKALDNGHLSHLNYWVRQQQSTYKSGVAYTFTRVTGSPDSIYISTTAGNVLQLHPHSFPIFNSQTGSGIYVVNNPTTPYNRITNLNATTIDSTGAALGKYFNVVFFGVVSENDRDCRLMMLLPGGSYANIADASSDENSYTNYNFPTDYVGTGFLICKALIQHSVNTWIVEETTDLRGAKPGIIVGGVTGAGGVSWPVSSGVFAVSDATDVTKIVNLNVAGVSTGTTRELTIQDKDITIAGLDDITAINSVTVPTTTLLSENQADLNLEMESKRGRIYNAARTKYATLNPESLVANYTYTFPNKDLTIAAAADITIDLPSSVGYRYHFNDSIVTLPSENQFGFNNTFTLATEMYIHRSYFNSTQNSSSIASFIGNLAVGSIITFDGIYHNGIGRRGHGEVRVNSVIYGNEVYYIGMTRLNGSGLLASESESQDTGQCWLGFNQAAGGGSVTVIDVETTEPFDIANVAPDGFLGYRINSYVSYVNLASGDVDFQTNYLYLSRVDVAQGINPEADLYDETTNPTGSWERIGTTATTVAGSSSIASLTKNSLRSITNYSDGDDVIVTDEQAVYSFNSSNETGVKPDDGGDGSWVKLVDLSMTKLIAVLTSNYPSLGVNWQLGKQVLVVGSLTIDIEETLGSILLSVPSSSLVTRIGAGYTTGDFLIEPINDSVYHPDPSIAMSDETSDLVPAENDATITITRAQTFTAFAIGVTTAPTDANILVSVLLNGVSIATITILVGEFYGTTSTISNTSGVVGDKLKPDLTQVGSTITGAGLKFYTLSNLV